MDDAVSGLGPSDTGEKGIVFSSPKTSIPHPAVGSGGHSGRADDSVKKRRLLSVRVGSYDGGHVDVVNWSHRELPTSGVMEEKGHQYRTLDSRQFLPTPGAPRINILIVGFELPPFPMMLANVWLARLYTRDVCRSLTPDSKCCSSFLDLPTDVRAILSCGESLSYTRRGEQRPNLTHCQPIYHNNI